MDGRKGNVFWSNKCVRDELVCEAIGRAPVMAEHIYQRTTRTDCTLQDSKLRCELCKAPAYTIRLRIPLHKEGVVFYNSLKVSENTSNRCAFAFFVSKFKFTNSNPKNVHLIDEVYDSTEL